MDIEKHNKLREEYKIKTAKAFEATYYDIQEIKTWDGDEPSWAEWGYVFWLEEQVINSMK